MADKLFVKDHDVVIPGEELAEGLDYLPAGKAFRDGDKIFASTIGLASVKGRVIKIIPLAGKYMPRRGDVVIGEVTGIGHSGWMLDVNSPYPADLNIGEASSEYIDLNKTDMTYYFDIGDYVLCEVINISEGKFIKLTAKYRPYRKLKGGNIIEVSPTKIPRIIGKAGSMIALMKDATGCEITVGQNGLVWISGQADKQAVVARVIKFIEREAHKQGLTDKVKEMLRGK
ncbi:MAG: RNA-binding protein [DPANN group archaeon]|nr:RNA-binding protein [DPANN group archaeon]